MKKILFKTNINCSGCVAKVTDILNQIVGRESWTVDTENLNKILTITNSIVEPKEIVKAIQKMGFKIEELTQS